MSGVCMCGEVFQVLVMFCVQYFIVRHKDWVTQRERTVRIAIIAREKSLETIESSLHLRPNTQTRPKNSTQIICLNRLPLNVADNDHTRACIHLNGILFRDTRRRAHLLLQRRHIRRAFNML